MLRLPEDMGSMPTRLNLQLLEYGRKQSTLNELTNVQIVVEGGMRGRIQHGEGTLELLTR